MPLAKSHSLPNKKDRKPKKSITSTGYTAQLKAYNEAEDIIDQVYVDICNGVSRFDCLQKLQAGLYNNNPMQKRQAQNYYNAAFDRLAINADIEAEKLRNLLYTRYETILEEAVKKGDVFNARAVLDSMAKVFLGTDRPNTAIQINSDKENGVTINFGFNQEDEA